MNEYLKHIATVTMILLDLGLTTLLTYINPMLLIIVVVLLYIMKSE